VYEDDIGEVVDDAVDELNANWGGSVDIADDENDGVSEYPL
jgi:hypothetical protein